MTHWSIIILSFCSLLSSQVDAANSRYQTCALSFSMIHQRPSQNLPNDDAICGDVCVRMMKNIPDFGKLQECQGPDGPIQPGVQGTASSPDGERILAIGHACLCDVRVQYLKVSGDCTWESLQRSAVAIEKTWSSKYPGDMSNSGASMTCSAYN